MKKLIAAIFSVILGITTLPSLAADSSSVQVGFSPEGSARTLVLGAIASAHSSIRMMAYSFTAMDIMDALVAAKKRGVDIKIVIDERGNRNNISKKAINYVVSNGIALRVDSDFTIQHDKVMIIDGRTVETGSYNFTKAAENKNSENAIVIWNMEPLAKSYLKHWDDRWNRGVNYVEQ
ncbi:phospholipase D family protein [Salmonella enterica subsp. enterica serovar Hvittingfoss]|nr:phospholipase D family protein [Salmonella enterica subsp. enterica serovar Hvittingfoss]